MYQMHRVGEFISINDHHHNIFLCRTCCRSILQFGMTNFCVDENGFIGHRNTNAESILLAATKGTETPKTVNTKHTVLKFMHA